MPPAARSRFASRSAPAAHGLSVNCSPNRSCWRPGAALGTALAWWSRGLLLALRPFGNTSVVFDLPLDARVLTFTIAVAVTTSLLFGLAPALRATRVDLTSEFQGGSRLSGGGGRSRLSQAAIVLRIALSLVLLVTTGLFTRTLSRLEAVDAGFNRHNLVLFTVDAMSAGYAREQFAALHSRLQARLEQVPGVRAAAFSRVALLSRVRQNNTITIAGLPPPPDAAAGVNMNGVSANFFSAIELPIVLGRGFTDRDDAEAPRVAVINQTLVKGYLGRENRLAGGSCPPSDRPGASRPTSSASPAMRSTADLRGVVPPTLYLPAPQQPGGIASFSLRIAGSIRRSSSRRSALPSAKSIPSFPYSISAPRTSRLIACTRRSGCSRGSQAFSARWRLRWPASACMA